MLSAFGASISSTGTTASIEPDPYLHGQKIEVPGDISSAAYFIAAGLLAKDLSAYMALVKSAVELSDDALREVVAQKGFEVVAISRK